MSADPARTRFFAIQALRWAGMAVAVAGMLALGGRYLPHAAGFVLVPVGLIASLIAPVLLTRRWRSRTP